MLGVIVWQLFFCLYQTFPSPFSLLCHTFPSYFQITELVWCLPVNASVKTSNIQFLPACCHLAYPYL